jgi:hypothetical protein
MVGSYGFALYGLVRYDIGKLDGDMKHIEKRLRGDIGNLANTQVIQGQALARIGILFDKCLEGKLSQVYNPYNPTTTERPTIHPVSGIISAPS